MGFLVSLNMATWVRYPLSLFWAFPPLRAFAKWRCDTSPPQKGYLSDTCPIPYENKANGCDTPSAILSRKGIARYGGVSRSGPLSFCTKIKGRQTGVFQTGGFPDLDSSFLFCPFLSFIVLFGTFPIFPGFSRFAWGLSGDFPDSSRFSFSAY